MNAEHLKFIDEATPEELLRRWRLSEDDPIFQGKTGKLYAKALRNARVDMGGICWTQLSKKVGWEDAYQCPERFTAS